jgi:uncharacterized membrane protein YqjE
MPEAGETSGGIFASLGRLLKTAFALAQNRLELLLVEWQEERWRLLQVLFLAGVVLTLAWMTLLVVTVTVVVLCLRANRFDLLAALTLLCLAATLISLWRLRARLKNWASFSATLAELRKDKACWDKEN